MELSDDTFSLWIFCFARFDSGSTKKGREIF